MALSFHTSLAKGSKRKVKILGLNSYFRRSYRGETGRGRFAPPLFQLLYLESGFVSIAYLTVANLARLGISVHCQVSVRSQYLVRLLSQCWITGGHTIHPPIEGLLPPTGNEPIPFQIQPPKQLDYRCMPLHPACHYNLIRVNSVTDSCWGLVLFLMEPIPNPSFWVPSSYKLNLEISC